VPKADGCWESKIDKYWREASSLKKKTINFRTLNYRTINLEKQ
jgi:hypothetical protein